MITEQQLKSDCTQDVIRKMVELAEGFKYPIFIPDENGTWERQINLIFDWSLFPLLIHRAVEGWNKAGMLTIYIDYCSAMIYGRTALSYRNRMLFNDYQPSSLTPCECACLHCLIEVLG